MKVSELIHSLQEIQKEFGDIPVAASSLDSGWLTSRIFLDTPPFYYDGGYLYSTDTSVYHHTNWKSSRISPQSDRFVKICVDHPENNDLINDKIYINEEE